MFHISSKRPVQIFLFYSAYLFFAIHFYTFEYEHCAETSNVVAVVLMGESFRSKSGQSVRHIGLASYDDQLIATRAQIQLCFEPLIEMGYSDVVVYLETRHSSQIVPHFPSWYHPSFCNEFHMVKEKAKGFLDVIFKNPKYSHILITRPDIIPTALFSLALKQADRNKILYPFHMWKGLEFTSSGERTVSDTVSIFHVFL